MQLTWKDKWCIWKAGDIRPEVVKLYYRLTHKTMSFTSLGYYVLQDYYTKEVYSTELKPNSDISWQRHLYCTEWIKPFSLAEQNLLHPAIIKCSKIKISNAKVEEKREAWSKFIKKE